MIHYSLSAARSALEQSGGYLYDMGNGVYNVTDIHPSEVRSFGTTRDAMDYAFRLAEAGYDETQMQTVSN